MIPPLSAEMHKGQAGRVGVIGGCEEFASHLESLRLDILEHHTIHVNRVCTLEPT